MTVLMPTVGLLVAARAYLLGALTERGNPLPVGVTPPAATNPQSYALLSRPGSAIRAPFLGDFLIRVRVFDADAVRLERNADLLHRLMMSATHTLITTSEGALWVTAATQQTGPSSLDDPDVPLFGMQSSVFWTVGLHPEPPAEPAE